MKEIQSIISTYNQLDKLNTRAALATVVRVEGSSYRRTGARMLVVDDGNWVGGISGGCLEGDALKRARLAIHNSLPSLVTYDTSQDDAYQIGVGLGCNGIIDVLFTPVNNSDPNNPIEILKSCVQSERTVNMLLTITQLTGEWNSIHTGTMIHYRDPKDIEVFSEGNANLQLLPLLLAAIESGKSKPIQMRTEDGREIHFFLEILLPPIHLILMGHQYDIYPLAAMARELGWRISIVGNLTKLSRQRLHPTDHLVGHEAWSSLAVDEYTAILLMAHDYKTDTLNLSKALLSSAPYIGMLGPRVRSERIWQELQTVPDDIARIYAPAGLDIGATSPEEIALSLLAEIKARFSGRSGGFLRLRPSTIHERN